MGFFFPYPDFSWLHNLGGDLSFPLLLHPRFQMLQMCQGKHRIFFFYDLEHRKTSGFLFPSSLVSVKRDAFGKNINHIRLRVVYEDDLGNILDIFGTGQIMHEKCFHPLILLVKIQGGEPSSIWSGSAVQTRSSITTLSYLGRMLTEKIHTDITINASDGSIAAHRAVLATRSPVFHSMFSHNLKEKELSTIDISDMSIEACQALLNYIYGNIQHEEFLAHRIALLRAADKYDIADLKEVCHDSLLEDIDTKNVLERLQNASLYQLPMLKSSCMRYLVNFGKIFDIRDDFNAFLQYADRELIAEIFQEVLNVWKGF